MWLNLRRFGSLQTLMVLMSVGTSSCEVITGENYIFYWRGGSDYNANATYGYCRVVLMG